VNTLVHANMRYLRISILLFRYHHIINSSQEDLLPDEVSYAALGRLDIRQSVTSWSASFREFYRIRFNFAGFRALAEPLHTAPASIMRPWMTAHSGWLPIKRLDTLRTLHTGGNGESRISRKGKARLACLAGEDQPAYRPPRDDRKGTDMPLPQDIRPVFQDIQDTLVRSEAPWVQQTPLSSVKVLWVGRETGTWASLHHWKKGYVAPPHKHLAGAHAFIISGKLQVRNGILNAGDYVYEPSGILHDATTALEDTTYLFICSGAVLFFDENGFTRYTNWEVMEKLRTQSVPSVHAEAAE
jgi:hypothetical protein